MIRSFLCAVVVVIISFDVNQAWIYPPTTPLRKTKSSYSSRDANRILYSRKITSSNSVIFANPSGGDENNDTSNSNSNSNNSNDKQNDLDLTNSFDNFLDTPFYDPDTALDNPDSSMLEKKFANFVKNDYYTAEGLLVGLFFVVLVILSQEILRIQVYGFDNYVPFSRGTPFGRLF